MKFFQAELVRHMRGRNRTEVADLALNIEGSDPDFSPDDVERIECDVRHIPRDGLTFRTLVAAVGMSLPEALAMIGKGYWPPLYPSAHAGAHAELAALCDRLGAQIAHYDQESGRMVIQL